MTGKWKPKPKKVVETSLGKAPKDSEKGPDLSHLRKPITTSVQGLRQIFGLFQTATPEVQDYISYECDILYECKQCRTIFRSLANFILHKREYCREKYHLGGGDTEGGGFVITDDLKTSDEDSRCATPITEEESSGSKKGISPIVDKLLQKQKINILVKDTVNEDLANKTENDDDDVIFVSEESSVVLQKVDSSKAAVFQTVKGGEGRKELIKNQVLEIHGILDNNQAVLDPSGKVSNPETRKLTNPNIPKPDLVCTECNFTFSTEKTLTHHIKYKHNKTCIVFPCPDCKETFSNAWSVYRHLFKVHRRTQSQVRRMRHLVHSSGIRKDQEPEKKKRKLNVENEENEENQWMNNFEGDKDFQMCGGCGKRFERKAALHSHSQMCTKRIAVCNNIKNVKVPAKEPKKVEDVKVLKGAAKRKQKFPTIVKATTVDEPIVKVATSAEPAESKRKQKFPTTLKLQEPDEPIVKVTASAERRQKLPAIVKLQESDEPSEPKTSDEQSETESKRKQKHPMAVKKVDEPIADRRQKLPTIQELQTQTSDEPTVVKVTTPVEPFDPKRRQKFPTIVKLQEPVVKSPTSDEPVQIPTNTADVTITKHTDADHDRSSDPVIPEIEIFTISDDSDGSEKFGELPKSSVEISDEYKEYVIDDSDHCFLGNALPNLDRNELKCIPCGTTFLTLYRLLRHMSLHYSWFRFQCSKCSFVSYHKYDCTTHAYTHHSTPNHLMESTVLPIPKWKVQCTSHDFKQLSDEVSNNNKMPQLKPIKESSETIVLEDDEMPDITQSVPFQESVILSDEERDTMNVERKKPKPGPSQVVNNRPIRNRTKSCKIGQTDFIYDLQLAKVFKYDNDSSVKNRKKKSINKV